MRATARRLAIIATAVIGALICSITSAAAYDGGKAAAYANTYWNVRSGIYPSFSNDCANFVSQSIRAGGLTMRTVSGTVPGAYDNSRYWYAVNQGGTWAWSTPWAVAKKNYYFMGIVLPYTTPMYVGVGKAGSYTPSPHTTGDPVYYDWNNDGNIDHTNMMVGIGDDPNSSYYGNIVNGHSNNRYHAIWHLRPYNSQYSSTAYSLVHIPSSQT